MTSSTPALPPTSPATVRLRSPADLVTLLPYLLGFHPTRSVVVVALRRQRVAFAARSDLPGPDTPTADQLAQEVLAVAARQHPDELALVGYGSSSEVDDMLDRLSARTRRDGTTLRDVLRVHEGRWWSYLCDTPDCCPPEGAPFDPTSSDVAARCALAGLAPAPSREQLAQALAPAEGPPREAMTHAVEQVEQELSTSLGEVSWEEWAALIRRRGRSAVSAAIDRYAAGDRLTDDALAELSVLLMSVPVRDAAWRAITTTEPHLRLWTDVTRRALPELAAPPASLLGFTAWRSGDGALARIALERALSADPDYSLARLLLDGLQSGVPPAALDGWPDPDAGDGS